MLKTIKYSWANLLRYSSKKAVFLALFLIVSEGFVQNSLAQNLELNDSIVKEIENTLLFDEKSNEEVKFYKKKSSDKKSDIVINRGGSTAKASGSIIKIDITDQKVGNFNIREKEKTAYNASLIEQYEVAIKLYKDVLVSEPNNAYAKFSLAVLYQKIGQLAQAKTLYQEILNNDPANKEDVIGNLLAILIEESPRDAIYLLSRLATQNPESPYIAAQSAVAYDKVKNYEQAVNMLKRAIALQPERVDYKYNLAVIYDKMGNYTKAIESYSEVIKTYDNNSHQLTSIDQIKKRIESIKSIL
jgi:tetratricopeptide (TPR) repeat protein